MASQDALRFLEAKIKAGKFTQNSIVNSCGETLATYKRVHTAAKAVIIVCHGYTEYAV